MHLWLSHKVFSWTHDFYGGRRTEIDRVRRPHAILAHAENVLATSESEFSVADSVLGLKRAINSRLQHLEELYGFGAMFPRTLGSLERLEQVGLARPLLVKQLFELRNDIEHNDAAPPSSRRARELVDATWYFLRTTDYACKLVPDSVIVRSAEEGSLPPEQWVSLRTLRDNSDRFEIAGWVSVELLADTEQPESFELDLVKLKSKPAGPPESADVLSRAAYVSNSARGDDERWIQGQAVLPSGLQREFWRLALDAL